jgi:hypothetical protein
MLGGFSVSPKIWSKLGNGFKEILGKLSNKRPSPKSLLDN